MKTVVVHFTDEGEKPLRFEGAHPMIAEAGVLTITGQKNHIEGDYLVLGDVLAIYAPGVWKSAILEETP